MALHARAIAALLASVAIASGAAYAADHPDTVIHYKTCDGSNWAARWQGDGFFHTPANGGAGHADMVLNYQTWGGTCWQLRWDTARGQFLHTPLSGGQAHPDYIMNYISWDGSKWTAFRANATTFYHIGPR